MTLQNKLIIIAVGLALLILSFFTGRWTYKPSISNNKDTVVTHDTTFFYTDVNHYFTINKVKLDTVKISVHDTVQAVTVASADTTIGDDSIYVKYYYPPLNSFFVDSHYKVRTTTITDSIFIPYHITFADRFNYSIQTGIGYGLLHKQVDAYVGVGLSFNLKQLF